MAKSKKTAVSCYLDPKLVDAYDRLEGKKPTMSSLFDFALAGYIGEVSGEEQMYQRVLSFNVKIRRGIAAQKKEQEEADKLLKQKQEENKNKKDAVIRGYVAEAVTRTSGHLIIPVKSSRDQENNMDYIGKIIGYVDYKHKVRKVVTEDMVISIYSDIKGEASV